MLWLTELQFLAAVQLRFRMQYGRQPPTRKNIRFWNNKLRTTSSLLRVKSPRETWTSEENVNRFREAFQRIPCKSFRTVGLQLRTNPTFNSARRCTQKTPPQSVEDSNDSKALTPSGKVARTNFTVATLERIDTSPDLFLQACFSEEATFHVNGV